MPRVLRALPLLLGFAPCFALGLALCLALPGSAHATEIVGMRLLSVGKDSATLRVELSEPGVAGVSWGVEPGAWTKQSRGTGASDVHELKMPGLSPDTRYFYQVDVDGTPAGDIATFVSGRSWVTRKATILATAAVPAEGPEDSALADRLFARESDALVLLGGEGDPATLRAVHGRAMTDRMVLTGPQETGATASVADVTLAWPGADLGAAAEAAGSCWRVGLASDVPDSDVVLRSGDASSLARSGERLVVTLAGRDSAELAFLSGTLTATLMSAGSSRTETLTKTCKVPAPAKAAEHLDALELEDELSVDGVRHESECDLP